MNVFNSNSMIHKIYLAGPFFTTAQLDTAEFVEGACSAAGVDAFSPRLKCCCPSNASMAQRKASFDMNTEAIKQCDLVLACIDDFDAGTMWEMGFAFALKKPVYAYTLVPGRGLNLMLAQSCAGFINGTLQLAKFLSKGGMVDFTEATRTHGGEII